jgi:hypothetical protein
MEQDFSKYSDEMLVKMWEFPYDLDENIFFVLGELENRKHPNTMQYCMEVLNNYARDEYFVSSAIRSLYIYDEEAAIAYAIQHYKEFHVYSLGSLVSLLWVDSNEENPSQQKTELFKLIKAHLKTLKKEEITIIQDDYDKFMKAYKDL